MICLDYKQVTERRFEVRDIFNVKHHFANEDVDIKYYLLPSLWILRKMSIEEIKALIQNRELDKSSFQPYLWVEPKQKYENQSQKTP